MPDPVDPIDPVEDLSTTEKEPLTVYAAIIAFLNALNSLLAVLDVYGGEIAGVLGIFITALVGLGAAIVRARVTPVKKVQALLGRAV